MGEFCAGAPRSLDKRSIRFRGGRGAVLAAGPSGDAARGAPLPVLAGVLSHATAYLGNDSGISHLAAALGVPSVVLFAAEGIIWRPWADHLEPGNGTVRILVDDGADARQTEELEAIFTGKKGGPGQVLGSLVSKWLPTQKSKITVGGGDNPSISVGTIGQVSLKRIADEKGRVAKLVNAPVFGAIEVETADLARSDGSRFADPEMRPWQGGGHGSVSPFSWRV